MEDTQTLLKNLRQTAVKIGAPVAWLRREASAGRIPFIQVGRRMMFNPEKVKAAIDALSGEVKK